MEPQFKKVDLFGGAITVNVPSDYADVSTIRQVPDHQEVYLSSAGFSSLIFDLGERVTLTATDENALRYHFEDIVDEKDSREVWSITTEGIELPHLPCVPKSLKIQSLSNLTIRRILRTRPNTPILSLLATTKPPSPTLPSAIERPPRPNTATRVAIIIGLIRLVNQNTDIAVTLNIPSMPEGEGVDEDNEIGHDGDGGLRVGKAVQVGKTIMEEVWRTFEIKDWSLFGGDQ